MFEPRPFKSKYCITIRLQIHLERSLLMTLEQIINNVEALKSQSKLYNIGNFDQTIFFLLTEITKSFKHNAVYEDFF